LETDTSSFLAAAAAADFCGTRASLSNFIPADLVDLIELVELILPLLFADIFPGSAANYGNSNFYLNSVVIGAIISNYF